MAARGAALADNHAAIDRFSAEVRTDLGAITREHAELMRSFQDQGEALLILTDEVKQLRLSDEQSRRRAETAEQQLESVALWMRVVSIVALLLLAACLGLLIALYLRHS